jgi:hypothetical protein
MPKENLDAKAQRRKEKQVLESKERKYEFTVQLVCRIGIRNSLVFLCVFAPLRQVF